MKLSILLVAATIIGSQLPVFSKDAASSLSAEERAKIKSQVEELQKSAVQGGERAAKSAAEPGQRKAADIKQQQEALNNRINQKQAEWSWVIGPDAAKYAADARRKGLSEEAARQQFEASKIAREEAAKKTAAAKKRAEGVKQTVEGLKSQVGKSGEYGLQPKGSNLYVRQYGK